MRRLAAALASAFAILGAAPAGAGVTQCWIDNGAVIVPAAFGDIAGDFIFDLSAPQSQLHVDRALEDGIVTPSASATLRLAGERIPATLTVANLDARTLGFPSTLNGLIGADVLAGYVVELRFSPCRIALWRRSPPRWRAAASLPIQIIGGVPTVRASITDGRVGLEGAFAIDTGALGVRVSDGAARLSRTPKGVDPASRERPPARLAALGLGGEVLRGVPAGIEPDTPTGQLGGIGDAVWSRYALRLDLRRGVLELAPAAAPRPVSGLRRARSAGS
jgi:hypothetical protein